MWRPRLATVIVRRLLLNYRADPEIVAAGLPAPFRPRLRRGYAVVGLDLCRTGRTRPVGLPAVVGVTSESASHRIAVEWPGPDGLRQGYYVPRRDSGSRLSVAVGTRVSPGVHHRASFEVVQAPGRLRVAYATLDEDAAVDVEVRVGSRLTGSRLFGGLAEASEFFRLESAGYSAGREPDRFDGAGLTPAQWRIDPCDVVRAASSVYDDRDRFPVGSIEPDCALLMRHLPARWTALEPLHARPA
jgi:hypothetical protein